MTKDVPLPTSTPVPVGFPSYQTHSNASFNNPASILNVVVFVPQTVVEEAETVGIPAGVKT